MKNKIPRTQEDLNIQLNEQLKFLKSSAREFDNGVLSEAKRMATTIRVLLHDTNESHSLLGLLNLKNGNFFSTCQKISPINNGIHAGSYSGLIGVNLGNNSRGFVPYLDNVPTDISGFISFKDYWNEIIFVDNENNSHSRKDIVLFVANQDGGSHIDPGLDEKYAQLSRQNSLGWMSVDDGGNWTSVKGAELAAIRQIAHELLRTLISDYPIQNNLDKCSGIIMGGGGIVIHDTSIQKKFGYKIGRNDDCPCGAKKIDGTPIKYKKCCGK